jgi:aspartyl/asparaginyl beta-hydroxylase (cupin superfamily)
MIELDRENPWGANFLLSKEDNWGINHLGVTETTEIKKEVNEYVEEWLIDVSRQTSYQTHEETFMYQLKELDYAWNLKDKVVSTSPNNLKTKNAIKELEYIYKNLESCVQGKVVRSEIINLSPNSSIRTHKDRGDLLYLSRRFHIPIITNPMCTFTVEGKIFHLEEGNVYELNNRRYHSVQNSSDKNRIHLIVDVLPIAYTNNIEFL